MDGPSDCGNCPFPSSPRSGTMRRAIIRRGYSRPCPLSYSLDLVMRYGHVINVHMMSRTVPEYGYTPTSVGKQAVTPSVAHVAFRAAARQRYVCLTVDTSSCPVAPADAR